MLSNFNLGNAYYISTLFRKTKTGGGKIVAEKCNVNIIQTAVYEALESEFPWIKSDGELYTYEIDADYSDRLSVDTIRRILENQYPKEGFYRALDNSYEDYIFTLENELCEKTPIAKSRVLKPIIGQQVPNR